MHKFEFMTEIQLDDDQMDIIREAYEKAAANGFTCPIECYNLNLLPLRGGGFQSHPPLPNVR